MRQKSANINAAASAITALCLIVLFLVFGFCPLRNTLVKLVEPQPARKAQPAPEFAKITSGQECSVAIFTRITIPVSGKSLHPVFPCKVILHGQSYTLAHLLTITTYTAFAAYAARFRHSTPIYLHNCALLI